MAIESAMAAATNVSRGMLTRRRGAAQSWFESPTGDRPRRGEKPKGRAIMSRLPVPLEAGSRLGPYEILAPLGAGGMGEVYRARDSRLHREVAVKVLPASVADDPGRRSRFEREARSVAALSHPNILAIFDFALADGTAYAVTELLDGETLREHLGTSLPVRRAVDIAAQIARGLAAAHGKGIVHRDLKPE